MTCPNCGSMDTYVHEDLGNKKRHKCKDCNRTWTVKKESLGKTESSDDISEDGRTITTRSADITSLDELLEYSDVDLSVWKVSRHIINSWEVTMGGDKTPSGEPETYTNYQVKAWLIPVDLRSK